LDPPTVDLKWQISIDGKAWPRERFYGGSFALAAASLQNGIIGEPGRALAAAEITPSLSPVADFGVFVTRDSVAREVELGSGAAGEETMRLMQAWGYAHDEAAANVKRP
jgi:hypothetical protein